MDFKGKIYGTNNRGRVRYWLAEIAGAILIVAIGLIVYSLLYNS